MPFGGNDWLALTQEPTLEPELPICDPHHHFWDRRLQSLPYQRYLLDELHADIYSGHNVRSTVEFIPLSFWYDAPLTSQDCDRRHDPWLVGAARGRTAM